MYRRTSSISPGCGIAFSVFVLLIGVMCFMLYANTQADIQRRQQQLDSGTVMCGSQQMQSSDTCNRSWEENGQATGLSEDSSYDTQRAVNQQDLDREKKGSSNGLWGGFFFAGIGLLSLWAFVKEARKNAS